MRPKANTILICARGKELRTELEEALADALGTGVRVRAQRHGMRAELHFDDLDQLLSFARERGSAR